jgi:hypothetical protein
MKHASPLRAAAACGLALAAAVTAWWLGSTRLALNAGAEASGQAASALQAAWFARASALALCGPRAGALRGSRRGIAESLVLAAAWWPVAVLAWAASTLAWTQVALAEGLLLAAGVALPLLGQRVGAPLQRSDLADALSMLFGAALAVALWSAGGHWLWPG